MDPLAVAGIAPGIPPLQLPVAGLGDDFGFLNWGDRPTPELLLGSAILVALSLHFVAEDDAATLARLTGQRKMLDLVCIGASLEAVQASFRGTRQRRTRRDASRNAGMAAAVSAIGLTQ